MRAAGGAQPDDLGLHRRKHDTGSRWAGAGSRDHDGGRARRGNADV